MVIAAPASGSGKTTVATGLMAALARRGLAVSPHKVGPDYIDPGYHALATGRPGRNLDPFLTAEGLIAPLFLHGARGADVAVIEGVMGLYDGAAGRGDFASTAQVAGLLAAPVVLVVDAAAAGRSVAAIVHGLRTFGDAWIGGVILNRIGSDRHARICHAAIDEVGLPVLGTLRRRDDVVTPSRHLGLIPAAERSGAATEAVDRLAALIGESCDLDAIVALARTAPPLAVDAWDPARAVRGDRSAGRPAHSAESAPPAAPANPAEPIRSAAGNGSRPVVAVAGGAAFTFGYAENAELLAAAGAEVVRFDPLRDETLPAGTRGLVIGGGFPEMYAAELSANERLRTRIAALDAAPIYAECAGLLYLTRALDAAPMCGILDATAAMTPNLTLGYRTAVAVSGSAFTSGGQRVRGHEFHRTEVTPAHGRRPAWQWSADGPEGFVLGNRLASYLHLHWAGSPQLARRFVEACR
ncbi:MAG TPA: cobyrinate a,c-diamide synthase [Streptosporangiaceae bacterium]|nr:cobyrinate a,c-diamide synthase [Streptosporangiaceae bacterium]